jgi:hypothetical protein
MGGAFAGWRFLVAREHRGRFQSEVECVSKTVDGATLLDAVYTVHNLSKRRLIVRSVTLSALAAEPDSTSGLLCPGEHLRTTDGHIARRVLDPKKQGHVGCWSLLPDERAGYSLRVLLEDAPPYLFVVGEVQIAGVHTDGVPGKFVKLYCPSIAPHAALPGASRTRAIGRHRSPAGGKVAAIASARRSAPPRPGPSDRP